MEPPQAKKPRSGCPWHTLGGTRGTPSPYSNTSQASIDPNSHILYMFNF